MTTKFSLLVLWLVLDVFGSVNGCAFFHYWPLASGNAAFDAITNVTDGDVGSDVSDIPGSSKFGYNPIFFNGTADNSYVDVRIEPPTITLTDYSLGFYFLLSGTTTGVLVEYVADNMNGETGILEHYRLEIVAGDVVFTSYSGVLTTISANFLADTWYYLWLVNDESKATFQTYTYDVDGTFYELKIDVLVNGTIGRFKTKFPGLLRFGNSQTGEGTPLTGSVTCAKMISCKANKNIVFNCTDMPVQTEATTTQQPPQTTNTTPTNVAPQNPTPTNERLLDSCTSYRVLSANAFFATPSAILASSFVVDVRQCTILCRQRGDCFTFVINNLHPSGPILCILGIMTFDFTYAANSVFYVID